MGKSKKITKGQRKVLQLLARDLLEEAADSLSGVLEVARTLKLVDAEKSIRKAMRELERVEDTLK